MRDPLQEKRSGWREVRTGEVTNAQTHIALPVGVGDKPDSIKRFAHVIERLRSWFECAAE